MIEQTKANLARPGKGNVVVGASLVISVCVIVFVLAGIFLSQPTAAVGIVIGIVVVLLAFSAGPTAPADGGGS